ncbi:DUF1963 domain-containing protein [Paenibacillus sp. KN14-4R]|uniref:DUF1963 domain-containing protein n=1 Tax=Paenibacillus sp. KN14-4R TaxID=3445773 RepID=UPI003FA1225D
MPCQQARERQERQEYIKRHRREIDLYEGVTNPVEVLKIMHTTRKYDPLIQYTPFELNKEQLYISLSEMNADKMQNYAVSLLRAGDEDTSIDILLSLICYRNKPLTDCIHELIRNGLYYPGILFKEAPMEIREQLLKQVEQDSDNRNHLLLALSWIGDDQVVRRFHQWRENKPQWTQELHVAPELYAYEAGWELTEEGERRNLFYKSNYAIEKVKESKSSGNGVDKSTSFLTKSQQVCPWCCGRLTNLLELEVGHHSIQHLSLDGERFKVQTCVICGCYSPIYMELDFRTEPQWSAYNQKPDYLPNINLDENGDEYLSVGEYLRIATEPRNTYHAVQWTLEPMVSQIGGHPTWIQDAEYPTCPCCSQSMHFIGQLDWSEVEEYGEGIYYMFLCPKGKITATLFQQS